MATEKAVFGKSYSAVDPKKQKRKKARIRVDIQGSFNLNNNKNKKYDCKLIDLGMGGLTMQTGISMYPSEKVMVEFKIGYNILQVNGYVGRVTGKDTVVRYDELPERETSILQEYIHSHFFKNEKSNK